MSKYDTFWLNEQTSEIHTPKFRMVWPVLPPMEARGIKGKADSKPKFNVTGLLPARCDLSLLKTQMAEELQAKFGKEWKKKKLLYCLLATENDEHLSEYKDACPNFLRMSANPEFPPFVYWPNTKQFDGQVSEIYSGRWATAAGKLYTYDNVNKGVSFSLNRIQLLDHDEPIVGGRVATASGFEAADVGSSTGGKVENASDVFGGADDDELPF